MPWYRFVGQVFRRWLEEPLGVVIPIFGFAIILLAPQMPDMFAGMEVGIENGALSHAWWHFTGLEVGATVLGFMGWYWSRAALLAPKRIDDWSRSHNPDTAAGRTGRIEDLDPSYEWAPRLVLIWTALICLSPLIMVCKGTMPLGRFSWLNLFISLVLLAVLFAAIVYRKRLNIVPARRAPEWSWQWRTTALLAAAPWGWPAGLAVLALSAIAVAVLACRPDFVEEHLHTPTAALLAMAFSIGPLVLALQLLRDVVSFILFLVVRILHLRVGVAAWSQWLGLVALAVCIYVQPFIGEDHDRYWVRVTDPVQSLDEPDETDCDKPLAQRLSQPSRSGRPCLDEALVRWRKARLDGGFPEAGEMPLIIVAAEGGASRAAVWLLSALRMLDRETGGLSGESLFAISGVSGGSLGAVTYLQIVAKQNRPAGGVDWTRPDVRNGLRDLGRGDLLAAGISTYFLNDVVARLAGVLWSGSDRGVALEMAFERDWTSTRGFDIPETSAKMGLLQLWRSVSGPAPHMLLNGTDRETGQRIITSTFRFETSDDVFAASRDFFGLVGCDVPASTAVMNSARFPFVSPAGRFVPGCGGRNGARYQLLDGGYFENYGARTAAELARKIRLLSREHDLRLVPIVVVVSNDADGLQTVADPDNEEERGKGLIDTVTVTCALKQPLPPKTASQRDRQGTGIVPETAAVLLGQLATRGAHGQDALHILRRAQCPDQDDDRDRFIHIALPAPEKEDEAAPMNWVLNPQACNYLLDVAPTLPFNLVQTGLLKATFNAMKLQRTPAADSAIDCNQ